MTRDQALAAADRAAQAVLNRKTSWLTQHCREGLTGGDAIEAMAAALTADRTLSAEVLYRLVTGAEHDRRPWRSQIVLTRVCFAVFRGTFLVTLQLAEAERAAPAPVQQAMPETMRERWLDDEERRHGFDERWGME